MVKEKPKSRLHDAEAAKRVLSGLGSGLKTVLSSHPATLGLVIMAATSVTLMVARKKEAEGSVWGKTVAAEASGLFGAAQGVTIAMAAVPIVTSIAGAVTEAVKKAPA